MKQLNASLANSSLTQYGWCCSLLGTLKQILEAVQPLQKLLELINPRYESELRHTFEQGRLNRVITPMLVGSMSFSAAKAASITGMPLVFPAQYTRPH